MRLEWSQAEPVGVRKVDNWSYQVTYKGPGNHPEESTSGLSFYKLVLLTLEIIHPLVGLSFSDVA